MRLFHKAMPLFLVLLAPALRGQQTTTPYDCNFTYTFSATGAQSPSIPNSAVSKPCVAWRITYTSTGFTSVTIQFETSPDNSVWTAVPNTICSSSAQPPCLTDGANPLPAAAQGSSAIRAYGKFVRINATAVSGTGSATVVVYGYKGTSASAATGGGSSSGVSFAQTALSAAVAQPLDGWLMQEGSGAVFNSVSGVANANPVTCTGAPTWNTGITGLGRLTAGPLFAGTATCTAANSSNFLPTATTPFSVSTWATFSNNNNTELLVAQLSTGANNPGWYMGKNNNTGDANCFRFVLDDASGGSVLVEFDSNQPVGPGNAGRLYHFVVTVDGTHTGAGLRGYIDGVQLSNKIVTDNMNGAMTGLPTVTLGSWAGGNSFHTGYQTSTRIYSGVLTPQQVAELFIAGPMVDTVTTATRTATQVYSSAFLGTAQDCVLPLRTTASSGTCTDNAVKLSAVAQTATQANPLDLVIDGGAAVSFLMMAPTGYTTIEGLGWETGLMSLPGSNHQTISNGFGFYPTCGINPGGNCTIPAQGANVILKNMKIDTYRGTFPTGNSTSGDARGLPQIPGVDINNIANLLVSNVWFYDSPIYHFVGGNLSQIRFENLRMETVAPTSSVNTDGIHIDGPADNITVIDSWFSTGDDSIAINAPEGLGGNITNVQILNTQEVGSAQSLRIYTCLAGAANCWSVSNVLISGMVGTTINNFFNLGVGNSNVNKVADAIKSVRFSNCTLTSSVGASFAWYVSDPIGEMVVDNCTWFAPLGSNPLFQFTTGTPTVSSLQFNNFKIYRNATGNGQPPLLTVNNSGIIREFTCTNCSVEDLTGSSYGAIAYLFDVPAGGLITTAKINGWDPTHFTTMLNSGAAARITNLYMTPSIGDCTSSASPAVCGNAGQGSAAIATGATTLQINTTRVNANSIITVTQDQSLTTKLGIGTCNSQSSLVVGTPRVTARTAGTSFTVGIDVGTTATPMCINWKILN